LAGSVANLQTTAFGKNLLAGRALEITHEDRLFLGAHLDELGRAAHGERGIGFAVGHLEPDHGAAVLLLERLHLAAGLGHEHGQRPATELRAALENGIDEALRLVEGDHGFSGWCGSTRARQHTPSKPSAKSDGYGHHAGMISRVVKHEAPADWRAL